MRDFSCFGDGAVSLAASAAAAGAGAALDRSLQAATATVYKASLSSRKEILVRVMWTRTVAGAAPGGATGLAVAVDEASRSSPSPAAGSASAATPRRSAVALASSPQFLHKKRGTRSFVTEAGTVVAIYWDTTDAKYPAAGSSSPEPTRDYYLAVVADGELARKEAGRPSIIEGGGEEEGGGRADDGGGETGVLACFPGPGPAPSSLPVGDAAVTHAQLLSAGRCPSRLSARNRMTTW
uniref:Uncharacterized protein n=1 Tax=Oryza glumipatula TaxID=40148 RepID=A0A0E0B6R9_9ORYZ